MFGIFNEQHEQQEQQLQQLLQQSVGAQQQEPQGAQSHKLLIQHAVEPMQDGKQVDGVHPDGIQFAGKPQTGEHIFKGSHFIVKQQTGGVQTGGVHTDGVHKDGVQPDGKPPVGAQIGLGVQIGAGEQISTGPHVIGAQQIGGVHTGVHNPPTTQDILLPTQHKNVFALQA